MVARSRVMWVMGALLSATACMVACGGSGSTNSSGHGGSGANCIPNASVTCACPGAIQGTQTCSADGKSYSMCMCSSTSLTGSGGSSNCGNGVPTPEKCTMGEFYCPQDCKDGGMTTSSSSGASSSSSSGGSCAGVVTYAGKAAMMLTSTWLVTGHNKGIESGDAACMAVGADHACDYDDIVLAASKGEITGLAATDTAWLQRTHSVTAAGQNWEVLGAPVAAGTVLKSAPGARSANWTYATDHANDCEFISFEKGLNNPTYHLDDNPCFRQPGGGGKDIPCGGNAKPRNVLCCFKKCGPQPPSNDCTCDTTNNVCM